MAITAAEAKSLLGQTAQADASAISPEEARSLLESSAQPTTGQKVEQVLASPGQTLLEGGQTLSRIVQGLPGAQPLARVIVGALPERVRRGLAALQVKGDILPQAPTPVKFGGALIGGGTAAELGGAGLGAAFEGVPALSKVAQLAKRFPRLARTAGTSAFGALTSPDQRGRGALLGAGLGAGGEIAAEVPQIAKFGLEKAKGLFSPFAAETDAKNTLNELSEGKSLEENSKSMSGLIRNKFNQLLYKSNTNFKSVLDKVGDKDISNSKTLKEAQSSMDEFTPNLKKVFNKFKEKPTFENAHNLRIDLGDEMSFPVLTRADRSAKQSLKNVRDTLKGEMDNFLENSKEAGSSSKEYQSAIDFHKKEVVPYKTNTAIRKIAMGDVKNPRNLTTIFKSPEGTEEAQNFTKTQKVLDDIGDVGRNKILFNELGKARNAQDLVNRFKKLDQQRLEAHVTPDLKAKMGMLETKIGRKEIAQRAVGGIGGATLGSLSGFPVVGTGTGATIGATVLPSLLKAFAKRSIGRASERGFSTSSITPERIQGLNRLLLALRGSRMGTN